MNHNEYWKRREDEALQHYIADEKAYRKEIERIYADMLDSCNEQINAFYGKYAKAEGITLAEAKKRVSKLDIAAYERKAKRYVKDKEFSTQANEEMRLYNAAMKINRLEMLKANIGLELIAGHDELEKFMGDVLQGRTEEELKRQAGILGKSITNNAQTAHAIVNASFHNATFSDRVWMYHDIMKNDLDKMLKTGLIQGKNPRALARELEKYVLGDAKGGAKFNAERLMRTELARVQIEAQKQSFERNGFEQYTFLANSSCCDACQSLDGKHFKVKDMMPGENAAPLHPNCRCSVAAYEDSADYNMWLDYLEKGGSSVSWENLKERAAIIENNGKITKKQLANVEKSGIIQLDNKSVREWYISAVARIKDNLVETDTIEVKAREAFKARNTIRTLAREMMSDHSKRKQIDDENPNPTFDELLQSKMERKKLSRDEALKDIIKTATKTNETVNKELGLGDE